MPLTTGDQHFNYLFGGFSGTGIRTPPLVDGLGGTTVVISGFAGTGKTVLACQVCAVSLKNMLDEDSNSRALIYSLEQPPQELACLMTTFGFLPASLIDLGLRFEDPIPSEGDQRLFIKEVPLTQATYTHLWQRIQTDTKNNPNVKLIVIDTINSALKSRVEPNRRDEEFRKLLELSREPFPVHLILTLEKAGLNYDMEEYVPRCVIELSKISKPGPGRVLEIKKARGQDHYIGPHDFEIVPTAGIRVFPSLHARSVGTRVAPSPVTPADVPFGVKQIDDAITPGLKAGSTTLLWGPPGAKKTDLGAKFLAQGLRTDANSRALFITFKIERSAFLGILRREPGSEVGVSGGYESRTEIIDARNPFELPTSVITRIIEYVESSKDIQRRAVVFGLRRLTQLPAYKESEFPFLEVLVNYLQQRGISTLLIDWPEGSPEGNPATLASLALPAIDLCANEIQAQRSGSNVQLYIRRRNYEPISGPPVPYP